MFFYEYIPAQQESCNSYITNTSTTDYKIAYHFSTPPAIATAVLDAKLDRVLFLLEDQSLEQEDELLGTMSTQEAAAFIAISKRTFERKVKKGLIHPITKNMRKSMFLKQDVIRLYIAFRGYNPPHMR